MNKNTDGAKKVNGVKNCLSKFSLDKLHGKWQITMIEKDCIRLYICTLNLESHHGVFNCSMHWQQNNELLTRCNLTGIFGQSTNKKYIIIINTIN